MLPLRAYTFPFLSVVVRSTDRTFPHSLTSYSPSYSGIGKKFIQLFSCHRGSTIVHNFCFVDVVVFAFGNEVITLFSFWSFFDIWHQLTKVRECSKAVAIVPVQIDF